MVVLRLVTVVLFLMGLSAPGVPEPMESSHDAQVVTRVAHGRHSVRSVRDVSLSPAGGQTGTSVQPMRRTGRHAPSRPMTIAGWMRKTPPSVPDSPPAPEDH